MVDEDLQAEVKIVRLAQQKAELDNLIEMEKAAEQQARLAAAEADAQLAKLGFKPPEPD